MAIKLIYENETDIPTGFAELYTERDGKWHLTGVDGMQTGDNVKRLETALKAERDAHKKTREQAKKLEKLGDRDIDQLLKDADDAPGLRDELEEVKAGKGAGGKDAQAQIDAALERERKKHQRDLENARSETTKVQKLLDDEKATSATLGGKIKKSLIGGELSKAAAGASVLKTAVSDVLMYEQIFEVVDDGQGGERVVTRDGVGVTPGLAPSDWLADRKSDRSHWWEGSVGGGSRGSGNGGPGGVNPFKKETFNVTQASQLADKDRPKADALAKQAGYKDADHALDSM